MRFGALYNTAAYYDIIAPVHSATQYSQTPQPSVLEIDYTAAGGAADVPGRHRRANPTYPLTI
jgi:hypothetical protein